MQLKLWKSYNDDNGGNKYVGHRILAYSKLEAIQKMEARGMKPDNYGNMWDVEEDKFVIF